MKTIIKLIQYTPNLTLRGVVRHIFNLKEVKDADMVVFDFASIKSMTRSFAHEYLIHKEKFAKSKKISEINVAKEIRPTFDVAKRPFVDTSNPKYVTEETFDPADAY